MTPMSEERRQCILMMQNMGWTATKKAGGLWRFSRPDSYGLIDVIHRKQSNISFAGIADIAILSGDANQLMDHIYKAKLLWVKERFKGITSAK